MQSHSCGVEPSHASHIRPAECPRSPEVAEALNSFSKSANKNTGSSHPRDLERWLNFLILSYRKGKILDTNTLTRWLTEQERWPEDQAGVLADQYEFGLKLLREYDKAR
jgi:hypothetical protein